jgi:hypothetical protein
MNNNPFYEPRTLLAPFEQGPLVGTFLRDTFFEDRSFPPTDLIEFDFRRGRRRMAPFVAPIIGGKLMERQGFETRVFRAPRIAPVRALRTPDLEPRMIGENIYQPQTKAQRAAELVLQDSIDLDASITRREEWMCREVLVNGSITVNADNGYQMVIGYLEAGSPGNYVSNHTPVTTKWDAGGSDPIADLQRSKRDMIRESGISPNVALFGTDAWSAFLNNANVRAILDNRRINVLTIDPVIESDALTLNTVIDGMQCYEYSDYFEDDAGNLFDMLPPDLVLLASTRVQNKIVYGAFTQLEKTGQVTPHFVTYQQARIPYVYADEEKGHLFYRLTSCPLPMPYDILGFRIVEALAGSAGPFGAKRPTFKKSPEEEKLETEALNAKSSDDLKRLADDEGIDLKGANSKADIVEAIKQGRRTNAVEIAPPAKGKK